MPAFTMPGLSSGQNTNEIIKKLVELEARPIKRLEKENNFNKAQVKVYGELKTLVTNLQSKTKQLVSFTAPFAAKKIVSNEEGYISGEATRSAKPGKRNIEILELATKNQVAGNKVNPEIKLSAGKFSILSKSLRADIDFPGGTLNSLVDSIKNNAHGIAVASITKVDSENSVVSLSALQYGEEAKLIFQDPNEILKSAGLVGENTPEPEPKKTSFSIKQDLPIAFQSEKFSNNDKEGFKATTTTDSFSLKTKTAYTFQIEKQKVEKNSYIEGSVNLINSKPNDIQIGFYYLLGEEEKIYFESPEIKEDKIKLAIPSSIKNRDIIKVIFSNYSSEDIVFQKISIVTPPEIKGAVPATIITEAKDAKLKLDGIEITRDKNEEIKDILEGVSLSIHKKTEKPIIVDIDVDAEKGINMLKEFVAAHNDLVKYSRDVTAVNRDGKISDSKQSNDRDPNFDISSGFWDNKNKSGILSGDNAVLRMLSGMRTITSASYPSSFESGYRVLSDIGLSTGAVGSSWKQIQEGLLQVDEETLKRALSDNPEAVRELFASDNNGDSRMDNGLGVQLLEHLKPYTQYTSGLLSTKIKLAEDLIAENNKKIKNYDSHLNGFEQKLKAKFMYMEQGMGKNKAIGAYLNNNLKMNKE
ncbi:MAG: flagellar filament capping protein FliD [Leptospiraceae bacterium]|nr:flagellar filament capping protein FliD [Leptospiraceae bacterium]MCK6381973.1 flagellar filament capping protein FliD [Leptospiraceae bacterium]NUM40311.1 flagellar filament capping protein FliD [Leptospiraceae bacterium]